MAKIWCENGEMVMRCSVLMLGLLHFCFKKWRNGGAISANAWWFAAIAMCYSGNYIVCFRRKRCAKTAKMYVISAVWQHIQAFPCVIQVIT